MAGLQKFDCTAETDDRARAMESLQLFTSVLFGHRKQFVMECETKPDGTFSLLITGSGRALGSPETLAEPDPAFEPFIIREQAEALDWGPEAGTNLETVEAKPEGKKASKKTASESVAQPE